MIKLEKVYSSSFFRSRKSLSWRAPIIGQLIKEIYKPTSVIDFGCAVGDIIQWLQNQKIDAWGTEGTKQVSIFLLSDPNKMFYFDLRKPFSFGRKFDVALCLEVAEHIEEECVDIFLQTVLSSSDNFIVSAAGPDQGGCGHVNCKSKEYWISKIKKFGYLYDTNLTSRIIDGFRPYAEKTGIRAYYYNTICFRRERK